MKAWPYRQECRGLDPVDTTIVTRRHATREHVEDCCKQTLCDEQESKTQSRTDQSAEQRQTFTRGTAVEAGRSTGTLAGNTQE